MGIDDLISLVNPELEKQFHAGHHAYKEDRYGQLKELLDYYMRELDKVGVTRHLLWKEYKTDYPNGYGRRQFFFHLSQHKKAVWLAMVLTNQPGEKLFIDFTGKKPSYIDTKTGEVMECAVFVASLPFSDYGFAMTIPNQSVEELLYALEK